MDGFFTSILPFLKKYGIEAALLAASLILTAISFVLFNQPEQSPHPTDGAPAGVQTEQTVHTTVTVEVSGAVRKPGVFRMPEQSRLKDAITHAGGLSEDADSSFFERNYNLARYVTDQEKIHVPTRDEVSSGIVREQGQLIDYRTPQALPQSPGQTDDGYIHINTALEADLESLPGVGKATALKIIENRPYGSLEDLVEKTVITERVFGQIRGYIAL